MSKECKDVRQFFGLSSFYSKFVLSYANVVGPFHSLIRNGLKNAVKHLIS